MDHSPEGRAYGRCKKNHVPENLRIQFSVLAAFPAPCPEVTWPPLSLSCFYLHKRRPVWTCATCSVDLTDKVTGTWGNGLWDQGKACKCLLQLLEHSSPNPERLRSTLFASVLSTLPEVLPKCVNPVLLCTDKGAELTPAASCNPRGAPSCPCQSTSISFWEAEAVAFRVTEVAGSGKCPSVPRASRPVQRAWKPAKVFICSR